MSHVNVVRAWKDAEYRLGLSDAERACLPENPAGLLDQTEAELGAVAGGDWLTTGTGYLTVGVCSTLPAFCQRVSASCYQ
jgi:mersacidin/lichenicidin family type 2 lantibiotic